MMTFDRTPKFTGEWECMECGYIEEGVRAAGRQCVLSVARRRGRWSSFPTKSPMRRMMKTGMPMIWTLNRVSITQKRTTPKLPKDG